MKIKKRFKLRKISILLMVFGISLILSGLTMIRMIAKPTMIVDELNYIEKKKDKLKENESSLSFIAVGDALIHKFVYEDASEKGNYNFDKMLTEVKPIIEDYDLAFYNQESILGGTSLGLSAYPMFNSPQEVGDAMLRAGFDMVSLSNNHSLDKGEKGLNSSLAYWGKQAGIMTAGSYESEEVRQTPVIMEKNGITYTLLAYSTLDNGLVTPTGKDYLFVEYDKAKVKADIERVRDKVDVLFVSMHWGEEYTHTPTYEEKEIAKYLASLGVDIVIGHHPHVVQPIEFIDNTMVIYSLGNFISNQDGPEKLTGLMASVTIKKTVEDGKTKIELLEPTAELIYTHSKLGSVRYNFKVYPYTKLTNDLLPNYECFYNKYMKIATGGSDKILTVDLKNKTGLEESYCNSVTNKPKTTPKNNTEDDSSNSGQSGNTQSDDSKKDTTDPTPVDPTPTDPTPTDPPVTDPPAGDPGNGDG